MPAGNREKSAFQRRFATDRCISRGQTNRRLGVGYLASSSRYGAARSRLIGLADRPAQPRHMPRSAFRAALGIACRLGHRLLARAQLRRRRVLLVSWRVGKVGSSPCPIVTDRWHVRSGSAIEWSRERYKAKRGSRRGVRPRERKKNMPKRMAQTASCQKMNGMMIEAGSGPGMPAGDHRPRAPAANRPRPTTKKKEPAMGCECTAPSRAGATKSVLVLSTNGFRNRPVSAVSSGPSWGARPTLWAGSRWEAWPSRPWRTLCPSSSSASS